MHFDQRWYILNARKHSKQQESTIQSRPVKKKKSRQKRKQNEANCINLFTYNCKITTDKLFQTPYFTWTEFQHTISTSIFFACVWCRLPRRRQVCTRNQQNSNCTYRLNLLWRAKPAILMRWCTIYTSAHTQVFKIHLKYIYLIRRFVV